jgi:hypothetical protein
VRVECASADSALAAAAAEACLLQSEQSARVKATESSA